MITSCQHEEGMSFAEIKQKVKTSDQQIRLDICYWSLSFPINFNFLIKVSEYATRRKLRFRSQKDSKYQSLL